MFGLVLVALSAALLLESSLYSYTLVKRSQTAESIPIQTNKSKKRTPRNDKCASKHKEKPEEPDVLLVVPHVLEYLEQNIIEKIRNVNEKLLKKCEENKLLHEKIEEQGKQISDFRKENSSLKMQADQFAKIKEKIGKSQQLVKMGSDFKSYRDLTVKSKLKISRLMLSMQKLKMKTEIQKKEIYELQVEIGQLKIVNEGLERQNGEMEGERNCCQARIQELEKVVKQLEDEISSLNVSLNFFQSKMEEQEIILQSMNVRM